MHFKYSQMYTYYIRYVCAHYSSILMELNQRFQGCTQLNKLDISCALVDYSQSEFGLFQIRMVYFYFITKILDLLDTVFFVLRKKSNQVTFLHLYHHMGMTCLSWIAVKYVAGGHSCYLGVLNTAVHAVMYTYYLLAALGPEYKKYLWWKKYITQIQIVSTFQVNLSLLTLNLNCRFSFSWFLLFMDNFCLNRIVNTLNWLCVGWFLRICSCWSCSASFTIKVTLSQRKSFKMEFIRRVSALIFYFSLKIKKSCIFQVNNLYWAT